ncbi:MAG: hypothetical protein DMG80_12665 [Acidobacteria bacterium]|nr:MAG: hypothetical protein DMG80_12665 [Acidobacteriota bacterium]
MARQLQSHSLKTPSVAADFPGQVGMNRNALVSVFSFGFLSVLSSAQGNFLPGAARVSVLQGEVSAQRGDTGDWSAAALNQPLVNGDRISTGKSSRTELQLDHANILRLSENAHAKITTLQSTQTGRSQIQVQIGQGNAYYSIFRESQGEVEIDTPNAAIRPTSKEGVYRIEVSGFDTQVIVRSGSAEISTPQGTTRVEMGEAETVRGTTDYAGNVLGGAPSMDSWDSWNDARDAVIRNAQSWNYTNRYYVGSEDLDTSGRWVTVPEYGRVWAPTVASNWSPYRAGRWVWEPYWRWTWVSHEPWGWTPYHYGRWFLYGKSWVWWPGRVESEGNDRPDWAPAYVSFFGLGGRRGNSVGFGSVGWLPIGPGDSFYPWYGPTGSQLDTAQVTDTGSPHIGRGKDGVAPLRNDELFSNVELAGSDERLRKAISALSSDRFGTKHSGAKGVSGRAFRDARLITGNLPIVPTRETLSATNRAANPPTMISSTRPQRFFMMRQPAAATAQSFDEMAAQIQQGVAMEGQLVPARAVTQMESTVTPQPMPLEHGVERTSVPARDTDEEMAPRSLPRPSRSLRVTEAARIPRPSSRPARRTPTLERSSRAATARVTSKSASAPRIAALSRVPTSTWTRRNSSAPHETRGSTTRVAQSYIESANRQLDKGNYSAAIANYKRASQVDKNSNAARTRLERARRAMQAERDIIASRR